MIKLPAVSTAAGSFYATIPLSETFGILYMENNALLQEIRLVIILGFCYTIDTFLALFSHFVTKEKLL